MEDRQEAHRLNPDERDRRCQGDIRWRSPVLVAALVVMCALAMSPFAGAQSAGAPGDVSELIERLKDTGALAREAAAQALGRRGPVAAGAVDALVATFADEDIYVRGAAAVALGQNRSGRGACTHPRAR